MNANNGTRHTPERPYWETVHPTMQINFAPYIGAFDLGKPGGVDIFERRRLIKKITKAHTKTSILGFLDEWAVRTGWAGKVKHPAKPLKKPPKRPGNNSASPKPPKPPSPPRQPAGSAGSETSMPEVVAQYAEASETLNPLMIKPQYVQVDEVGQGFFEAGNNVWKPGSITSEGARIAEFTNTRKWKQGLPIKAGQVSTARTGIGGWLEKAYPDAPSYETLDSEGRLAILKQSQMRKIKAKVQGSGGGNRASTMQMEWIDADLPKDSRLKKNVRIHPIFAKAAKAAKAANDGNVRRAVTTIKKGKDLNTQKKALQQKLMNVETAHLLMHASAFLKEKAQKKRAHKVAVHKWSWDGMFNKKKPRGIMRKKPLPLMTINGTPNYTYAELESWSKHNDLLLGKRLLSIREKYYHRGMLRLNETTMNGRSPPFKLMTNEDDHKYIVALLDLERKYHLASAHANSLSDNSMKERRLKEAKAMYDELQELPRPTCYGRAPRGKTQLGAAYYPRWYLVNIHHFVAYWSIARVDEILRPVGLEERIETMKMMYNANMAKFAQLVTIEVKAKVGGSTTKKRLSRWELFQMQKTQAPRKSSSSTSIDQDNTDYAYYVIGSNDAPVVIQIEKQPLRKNELQQRGSDLERVAQNIDVADDARHLINNPPLHFRYGVHEPISNVGAHTESALYRLNQDLTKLTDELIDAKVESDRNLLEASVRDLKKEIVKLESEGLTGRALLRPYVTQLTKLRIRDIDSETTTSDINHLKEIREHQKFWVTRKVTRKQIQLDDVVRAYEKNYFVDIPNNYTGHPLEMDVETRKYAYDNKIDLSSFRSRKLLGNPRIPIKLKDLTDWITRRSYTPKELAAHSIAVDARHFRSLTHADEHKLFERITAFKTNLLADVTLTPEKRTELVAKMEEAAEALQDRITELNVQSAPLFVQPWDF